MAAEIERIADGLALLAQRADCKGLPAISITFDRTDDLNRFKEQMKRDLEHNSLMIKHHGLLNLTEMTVRGVRVRML